jgi:fimbrial chaperone protein
MSNRLAALAIVIPALLASAGPTRASEVQINPVVVSLSPAARSAIVVVRNSGQETTRFELQVRSWGQDPDGEMLLAPTAELAVYPPVLTLAPGEERNVRIGASTPFGPVEKTYRVFLQEMAPPEKPDAGVQVRVVSRIGLPVFLAPAKTVEKPLVADLAARAGKATFRLVNEGTVHVRPTSVKVVGLDAAGKQVVERELNAWYVLAGGERRYQAEIPKESCGAVREIEVQVTIPREVLRAKLQTPNPCAP